MDSTNANGAIVVDQCVGESPGEEDVELQHPDQEKVHVGDALELLPEVLRDEVVRGVVRRGDVVGGERPGAELAGLSGMVDTGR
jgi:hypothetical protein